MTPLQIIEAYQTSDGKQFLPMQKLAAEIRQRILDAGNKPCDSCACTGKRLKGIIPHIYESDCEHCAGKGFLVPRTVFV